MAKEDKKENEIFLLRAREVGGGVRMGWWDVRLEGRIEKNKKK